MKYIHLIAIAVLLPGCGLLPRTEVPKPIVSQQASFDKNRQDSGIHEFRKDRVVVSRHFIERYDNLLYMNSQRPDWIKGDTGIAHPNPNKVIGIGQRGDRMGIRQLDDDNYLMDYHTLMIFDRLSQIAKRKQ